MRLLFARHGESQANVERVFSNRGWKHPLTPAGLEQAGRLADALAARGIVAVYASPVRRASETARVIAERLTVPFVTEAALAEYDVGDYEGSGDPQDWRSVSEIETRWDRGETGVRMPGGESLDDIRARFVPFVHRLVVEYGARHVAVVLVGHGGTFCRGLPMVLTNVSPREALDRGLGYTSMVESEWRDGALRCARWDGQPLG